MTYGAKSDTNCHEHLPFANVRATVHVMATNTPFGPWESLRIIRERSGLSLRQLARDTPISASYLCALENGNRWPTPLVTSKLAAALHVPYTAIARIRPNEEGVA